MILMSLKVDSMFKEFCIERIREEFGHNIYIYKSVFIVKYRCLILKNVRDFIIRNCVYRLVYFYTRL